MTNAAVSDTQIFTQSKPAKDDVLEKHKRHLLVAQAEPAPQALALDVHSDGMDNVPPDALGQVSTEVPISPTSDAVLAESTTTGGTGLPLAEMSTSGAAVDAANASALAPTAVASPGLLSSIGLALATGESHIGSSTSTLLVPSHLNPAAQPHDQSSHNMTGQSISEGTTSQTVSTGNVNESASGMVSVTGAMAYAVFGSTDGTSLGANPAANLAGIHIYQDANSDVGYGVAAGGCHGDRLVDMVIGDQDIVHVGAGNDRSEINSNHITNLLSRHFDSGHGIDTLALDVNTVGADLNLVAPDANQNLIKDFEILDGIDSRTAANSLNIHDLLKISDVANPNTVALYELLVQGDVVQDTAPLSSSLSYGGLQVASSTNYVYATQPSAQLLIDGHGFVIHSL